jgi:PAS domain S-box-containing protein
MAALLVTTSLLPLAILGYVDLRQDQARVLNSVKDLLVARGDQIVHELDSFHRGYQRSVDAVAHFPDTATYCAATPERRVALHDGMLGILAAFSASDAAIRGMALLDGSGRIVLATEAGLAGVDISDRPVVAEALRGRPIVSDVFVSSPRTGSVPTIAYMAPMLDADRRVTCVAVLWLRATSLWNTVKTSNALVGPGSFAVLFDREGIRIAHTFSDDIVFHPGGTLDPATLERLVAERRFGARTRTLLEDVRAFPEQFERARAASPDLEVFRGFAPVNQTWNFGVARRFETVPWTVFYMVPEAAVVTQLAQAMRQGLLLSAAVIAIAAIVGLAFAARILRPVRALRRAVTSVAGGDLAARVGDLRGDELGRLGASFNAMAGRIQEQDAALRHSRDHLEQEVQVRTAGLHRAQVLAKLAHVITRPDGSFEAWSRTLPPLIGVKPDRMPQSTREWMKHLHPEDRSTFRNASIAAGVSGTRTDVEYRVPGGDGAWIHVRQVIEPLPGPVDADGRTRWFSTMQDVTEQKRSEEELRASEERTRAIVDTALDAVITMNGAGVITGWSPQAETTFGWTRAEAVGQVLAQTIIPQRHREDHRRGLERYLATGEAVVLNKRIELIGLHRDGREFPIDLSITSLRTGVAPIFSAFVRDITDRKLAQARLQAQLERLTLMDQITRAIGERQDLQSIYQVAIRSLEERLPVDFACVLRYDAAGKALTVVRVGAHSQGLAAELAMDEQSGIEIDQNGLSRCVLGELVYEPDIRTLSFPFPQRLAGGGLCSLVVAPLQSESRVFGVLVAARRQPGAFSSGDCEFLRQLSAHVALAAQQAELHGALQQAYDDLRQTQKTVMQQERLRALGQMASGIAHDINNALSPVALYTESLLEREPHLSERGRGYLVTIARAIEDVSATVARLREFYRQREPQLLLEPLHLNALMQQVVDLTRARWSDMPQQRGTVIRLEIELAPGLPAVLGVESEVREALINLLFNAVDAMPDGGVLTLRTHCTAPHRGADATPRHAVVEVTDTGAGMDEETRRRCLEPFFTTKGERGTGLGLAMVYGMTQRHGANVEVESAVGRGTTMRLSFPIPATAPVASAVPPLQRPALPLRILIVDDDPAMLESLRAVLALDGHSVVTADGGQAGIDAFHAARPPAETFDVVITDLGMPYVDGRKVASAVKTSDPATPVILLTGWGQRLVADGEIPAHVDRVLSKPPKLREVRAALAELTQTGLRA